MDFQICDVMMIISALEKVYFLKYLSNPNSLSRDIWSANIYNQMKYFSKNIVNDLEEWE